MIAIIGGSGLGRFAELDGAYREPVTTPYGAPSAELTHGRLDGVAVVFLARHGDDHQFAPHAINYRANLWALAQTGVDGIISVATVGALRAEFRPGALVLADQVIDYTHGRAGTFFDGVDRPVTHVDFTEPFDLGIRQRMVDAAKQLRIPLHWGGTYGCTQGPRLESAAEIRRLARDGCDLVGMTAMPEAVLARELGIPFATLAVVANHAAGIGDSAHAVELAAIPAILEVAMGEVRAILRQTLKG